MARPADHEERRLQIAEAVWRLAAKGGLEDVTMRRVAAEAGISTRLVQYYFSTRERLLADAFSYRLQRDRKYIEDTLVDGTPRERLRNLLLTLVPLDKESRDRYLVNVAYFVRAISDPDIISTLFEGGPHLDDLIVHILQQAKKTGQIPDRLDLAMEAEKLVAVQDGMSSRILLGVRDKRSAEQLIDYVLDGIFIPDRRNNTPSSRGGR
ncbi:TetR/AcrR family transcriptional regulator [Aliihoeflea sp. PC F10.4]